MNITHAAAPPLSTSHLVPSGLTFHSIKGACKNIAARIAFFAVPLIVGSFYAKWEDPRITFLKLGATALITSWGLSQFCFYGDEKVLKGALSVSLTVMGSAALGVLASTIAFSGVGLLYSIMVRLNIPLTGWSGILLRDALFGLFRQGGFASLSLMAISVSYGLPHIFSALKRAYSLLFSGHVPDYMTAAKPLLHSHRMQLAREGFFSHVEFIFKIFLASMFPQAALKSLEGPQGKFQKDSFLINAALNGKSSLKSFERLLEFFEKEAQQLRRRGGVNPRSKQILDNQRLILGFKTLSPSDIPLAMQMLLRKAPAFNPHVISSRNFRQLFFDKTMFNALNDSISQFLDAAKNWSGLQQRCQDLGREIGLLENEFQNPSRVFLDKEIMLLNQRHDVLEEKFKALQRDVKEMHLNKTMWEDFAAHRHPRLILLQGAGLDQILQDPLFSQSVQATHQLLTGTRIGGNLTLCDRMNCLYGKLFSLNPNFLSRKKVQAGNAPVLTTMEKISKMMYYFLSTGIILFPVFISPVMTGAGYVSGMCFYTMKRCGLPGMQKIANWVNASNNKDKDHWFDSLRNRRVVYIQKIRNEDAKLFAKSGFIKRIQMLSLLMISTKGMAIPLVPSFIQGLMIADEMVGIV